MNRIGKVEMIVFVAGFSVMVLEIVGSRLIAPYFGNTLFVWTSLIGVVLASLAIGYYLGGRIADKQTGIKNLFYLAFGSGILIAGIPLLSDVILKFSTAFGVRYGPLISSIFLVSIPNVLLGMVSPYAVKIKINDLNVVGSNAGDLYAISTLGSIIGTFVTGFYLIPTFGVKIILIGVGIVLGVTGLMAVGRTSHKVIFLLFILLFLNLFSLTVTKDMHIIYEKESAYQLIRVEDVPERGAIYLRLDNTVHSGAYVNSTELLFAYTKCSQIARLVNPNPRNVLFIGLGGGSEVQEYFIKTTARLDVVEIDRDVIETTYRYFNLSKSNRITMYAEDGRSFTASSDKRYDVVFMDAFNSYSIPFQLTTYESTKEVKRILEPDGILVTNIISSVEGEKSLMFKSMYKTYKTVFPYVYVFHIYSEPKKVQNVIMVASSRNIEGFFENVSLRENFSCDMYKQEIDTGNALFLSDDYAPVENLMVPIYK